MSSAWRCRGRLATAAIFLRDGPRDYVTALRVFHGGRLLLGDLDLSVQLVSWREKVNCGSLSSFGQLSLQRGFSLSAPTKPPSFSYNQ